MDSPTHSLGVAAGASPEADTPRSSSYTRVNETLQQLVQADDIEPKVEAAKEIRRLTKTSQSYRRHFSKAVKPLVEMLRYRSPESNEAALLNLAVKDEMNKTSIIDAGALDTIIGFLQSDNPTLQEHAAASILTLSASSVNKPIITAAGTIRLLVEIRRDGCKLKKNRVVGEKFSTLYYVREENIYRLVTTEFREFSRVLVPDECYCYSATYRVLGKLRNLVKTKATRILCRVAHYAVTKSQPNSLIPGHDPLKI